MSAASSPPITAPRRRRTVEASDGSRVEVDFDLGESPLVWLFNRRDRDGQPLIALSEFAAGERFRRDYETAGLAGRITMNWQAIGGPNERRHAGAGGSVADARLDAHERVRAAVAALGPDLGDVAVDVCCHFSGLTDLERNNGWPQRSGKIVLRLALSALARHYGLADEARGPRSSPLRNWRAGPAG